MSSPVPPSLLIRGGRVVDPASGIDAPRSILIAYGRIDQIGPDINVPPDVPVIDAAGQIVCPGFIDLHTHLRYPGFPDKETMQSGTAAAAAGGFTTVCAMANTNPVVDSPEILREVEREAGRVGVVRVRQLAAVSRDLRGEQLTDMAALAEAGAVAFSDDGKPVWNERIMREALRAGRELGKRISAHEENPTIVHGGVANDGEPARRLGLPLWPCAAETGMVARDVDLLAQIGGHLHIAHVSCAATADVIRRAKDLGLDVTAEVTPHHLRLTDRLLEGDPSSGLEPGHPCTKVNPPLRSPQDVEAMIAALADGTIDAVATDHAPHSAADKSQAYERAAFGISAIETALPLSLELVRLGHLDLFTLIERLTTAPARVFGIEAGTLAPGSVADVCIFDPDHTWQPVPEELRSRGKNTPVAGMRLKGRVTCTIVGGVIVSQLT